MAQLSKCDRCSEIVPPASVARIRAEAHCGSPVVPFRPWNPELCPACMAQLSVWLRTPPAEHRRKLIAAFELAQEFTNEGPPTASSLGGLTEGGRGAEPIASDEFLDDLSAFLNRPHGSPATETHR